MVLRPGFEPGSPARKCHKTPTVSYHLPLDYNAVRDVFVEWLESRDYNNGYAKDVVSYLDRYVDVIKQPLDVALLFNKLSKGKSHLVKALRVLFNFYEVLGYPEAYMDLFRKGLPKVQCGIDLRIPSETKIAESLRKLPKAPLKYQALYNLLVDSGLRLVESVYVINNFKEAERVNGFYRCELAMFRGEKQAYYGHFTEHTLRLIKQVNEKPEYLASSRYFRKFGYVAPKYLRKFAFDKMIDLDVPESIADFIQGRVPKKIGAKHYMALARQASKFYPRYARYVETLRSKASN